jgi:hypothetical protein
VNFNDVLGNHDAKEELSDLVNLRERGKDGRGARERLGQLRSREGGQDRRTVLGAIRSSSNTSNRVVAAVLLVLVVVVVVLV